MNISSFLRAKTEDSITRLCFFLLVLAIIAWETYAVQTRTVVPGLEAILTFTAAILANKQYQERKASTACSIVNNTTVPVQEAPADAPSA